MHQLNLQYNQLHDDYEALKRELYATQDEHKHLKEQLKQSKFGFDSIKDTNAKFIFFLLVYSHYKCLCGCWIL